MNDTATKPRERFGWWPLASCLLLVVAIFLACYALAVHDVKNHLANPALSSISLTPQINRMRPSLHHGLWFEFKLYSPTGDSEMIAYWRLHPWRAVEIYVY